MFGPRVAKPLSTAHQPSTVQPQSRLALEPASLGNKSRDLWGTAEQESLGASWDLSSIQILPPDRTRQPSDALLPGLIQAKLMVGQDDDQLEQEADRVADEAMRTPSPAVSAAAAPSPVSHASAGCDEAKLRRKPVGPQDTAREIPATVGSVLGTPGQPLDAETTSFMEPRLGFDFSGVRVHSDRAAARSARSLRAAAYTTGHHIVFGAGHFAPGTRTGLRLIAHELAHVVQQRRVGPLVQREPLPEYKSSERIVELRPLVRPGDDSFSVTVEGDFTTPEAVGRLIWPRRPTIPPPGVTIKRLLAVDSEGTFTGQDKKPTTLHRQETSFELNGIAPFLLEGMDPSIRTMFEDQGVAYESKEIGKAREKFRERHSGLGLQVLNNIDAALKRVTRNNPDLLLEYYRFHADWRITDDKIDPESGTAGNTDRAIKRGGAVTDLNPGLLQLRQNPKLATDAPLSLLGSTLIHEFVHTAHASDTLKGPGEGKAYGIENFFAERMGDQQRDDATMVVGPRMGDKLPMDVSYRVMKRLYEVIDTGVSKSPHLKGVTRQRARELSVEFISKNRSDFGLELKAFILAEEGWANFNSLPSRERR